MRILLVEDDPAIARFVKKGLEAERYLVDVAGDGADAIQRAEDGYALVLLDLLLPKVGGLHVCRELRARGVAVPILMLTAKDSVEDKVSGLGAGADDYLTKPFAFTELLARVRALLRRAPVLDMQTTVEVGDLVLDTVRHDVHRGGRRIELTAREFALLEHLMRRRDRVSTRTVIEQEVWGYAHDPWTNVVDVYIRRLRQKVDRGFPTPLIHTIRGVGYVVKNAD